MIWDSQWKPWPAWQTVKISTAAPQLCYICIYCIRKAQIIELFSFVTFIHILCLTEILLFYIKKYIYHKANRGNKISAVTYNKTTQDGKERKKKKKITHKVLWVIKAGKLLLSFFRNVGTTLICLGSMSLAPNNPIMITSCRSGVATIFLR